MAQAIHCDAHNREHLADVLVSQIANGDTAAFCFAGYVEVCRLLVEDADAAAIAAQAEAVVAAAQAGDDDQAEADQAAADAAERLGDLGPDDAEVDRRGRQALDEIVGAEYPALEPDTTPATVVRKGTSRSRAAYEARRRAKGGEVAPEATDAGDAAPASTDDATEDASGVAAGA